MNAIERLELVLGLVEKPQSSAAEIKGHLVAIHEAHTSLEKAYKTIEAEHAKLKAALPYAQDEFLTHETGVYFKRERSTGGKLVPICPRCHSIVHEESNGTPGQRISCAKCGWFKWMPTGKTLAILATEL
jgi:ribosomal protein S27AE